MDRRFNRSRYNAEAVVAGFTARMRQTVDFDAVHGEHWTDAADYIERNLPAWRRALR